MKPVLIFKKYNEDHNEFTISINLVCSVNGKEYEADTGLFSSFRSNDTVRLNKFVNLVEEVTREVMDDLIKAGDSMMDPREMVLSDRLSLFDIKQTPEFNNALEEFGQSNSIILDAIW
jgi:hypothetical protein